MTGERHQPSVEYRGFQFVPSGDRRSMADVDGMKTVIVFDIEPGCIMKALENYGILNTSSVAAESSASTIRAGSSHGTGSRSWSRQRSSP